MPMPDHGRLHSPPQLANVRVKAKGALRIAGNVAEAARERARIYSRARKREIPPGQIRHLKRARENATRGQILTGSTDANARPSAPGCDAYEHWQSAGWLEANRDAESTLR